MSSRRLNQVLAGTVALLLGVIGYGAYRLSRRPPPPPPVARVLTNTLNQIAVRKVNSTNLFAMIPGSISWSSIESTNYTTYIKNLRDIGCPEETVRDIILTDISKLYAKRRAALRAQLQPYRFWQTGDALQNDYRSNPELQGHLQELEKEQRALVKQLLGVDYRAEMSRYWVDENNDERMYGFLPEQKQDQLKGLQSKYDELEQEIYTRSK